EGKASPAGQLGNARFLQLEIVVVVQVVDADHGRAGIQECARDVKADEASRARDQDRGVSHGHGSEVVCNGRRRPGWDSPHQALTTLSPSAPARAQTLRVSMTSLAAATSAL